MRVGELKSLLAVLRAHGVSEFTDTKRCVSLKLGGQPVTLASKAKPEREPPTLQEQLLGSKTAQATLKELGVDAAAAAEVVSDVS